MNMSHANVQVHLRLELSSQIESTAADSTNRRGSSPARSALSIIFDLGPLVGARERGERGDLILG